MRGWQVQWVRCICISAPYLQCVHILNNGWKYEGIRHVYSVLFK